MALRQPASQPAHPALSDLTDDLLLRVIHLGEDLHAMIAFTSTNRRLRWLGNTAVPWQLAVTLWPQLQGTPHLASLRAWLARKRGALRRLLLLVNGDDYSQDDVPTAKAVLSELAGGSLRSLSISQQCGDTPRDAGFGIDTWVASFPSLELLEMDLGSPTLHTYPPALLQLTALRALEVSCDYTSPGGLGQPGQAACLPPSLTSLELTYASHLPRLDSTPGLRRLWINNVEWDIYPYALDVSGLDAATALTALSLNNCVGLAFTEDLLNTSSGSDSEEGPKASLVPLAMLPHLQGLTLQNCGLDTDVHRLALASTGLTVLNVCYNSLRAVPLARDDCRALQRLCCDLSALAGSGHLLGEMPALEEVDVLWCHRKAQSPPLRPSAEECKRARGQQAAALAALRSAHRLRVVGLEDSLASALGGGSGSWDGEAYWAAGAAAREAWERDLPGKKVVQVHTHLGPGRRMPDYGQLAWDEV